MTVEELIKELEKCDKKATLISGAGKFYDVTGIEVWKQHVIINTEEM